MAIYKKLYPEVIPKIDDWPVAQLSKDRSAFIKEMDDFVFNKLMQEHHDDIADVLSKTIYLERIRVAEEPWRVDPPKEASFWRSAAKKLTAKGLDPVDDLAQITNEDLLKRIINRYSEEIVGTFQKRKYIFARRLLTFFFGRLLNSKVRGDLQDQIIPFGAHEQVRDLFHKGTVVVVPTHFSNLDSTLIGYMMDLLGWPSFSYGAGLNLYNFGPAAYYMNRLGAYRVDRRKKNPIYLETLKAYTNLSMQRGVNNLLFPGGTRSRSGRLETELKLGLLGTSIEAQRTNYQNGRDDKIFIVPVVLGYHFVLEARKLIWQYLKKTGKEKFLDSKNRNKGYSIGNIFKLIWEFFTTSSEIMVSFGEPMDVLGNLVNEKGDSLDQFGNKIDLRSYFYRKGKIQADRQRENQYTQRLGEKIIKSYHRNNVVMSSHLVAFTIFNLLRSHSSNLDLYGTLRQVPKSFIFERTTVKELMSQLLDQLKAMEAEGKIMLSNILASGTVEDILNDGTIKVGKYYSKKPVLFNKEGDLKTEDIYLLYYYHNRLDNYHLDRQVHWKSFDGVKEEA